jgi:5-methylcytosine-specific restriction protein A
MSIEGFEVGHTYNRRRDIHAKFSGQQQGGIITPSKHPLIFAITGASGRQHGYEDRWEGDGSFRYFGEGQVGDMKWERGNTAIRDHAADGRELLLFEVKAGGLQFRGPFNCAGYSYEQAPDRKGNERRAIVFHLMPVAEDARPDPGEQVTQTEAAALSLSELRRRAYAAAGPAREVMGKAASSSYYARSSSVRTYVLSRAAGKCEGCGSPAPFTSVNGAPYLEPHHIRRLTDQGPDDPRRMAALCPNCHREVHHGRNGDALNRRIQQDITAKGPGPDVMNAA